MHALVHGEVSRSSLIAKVPLGSLAANEIFWCLMCYIVSITHPDEILHCMTLLQDCDEAYYGVLPLDI